MFLNRRLNVKDYIHLDVGEINFTDLFYISKDNKNKRFYVRSHDISTHLLHTDSYKLSTIDYLEMDSSKFPVGLFNANDYPHIISPSAIEYVHITIELHKRMALVDAFESDYIASFLMRDSDITHEFVNKQHLQGLLIFGVDCLNNENIYNGNYSLLIYDNEANKIALLCAEQAQDLFLFDFKYQGLLSDAIKDTRVGDGYVVCDNYLVNDPFKNPEVRRIIKRMHLPYY
jgi:hypothetical protein